MAKLVEILAQELKEWPTVLCGAYPTEAIAQDLDGGLVRLDHLREPHPTQFNGEDWSRGCWTGCAYYAELSEDHATAIVTRAEWQAAVDALKTKEVIEWDGSGLPPVGTKVEVVGLRNEYRPKAIEDWKDGDKVECVAHHAMQGEHVVPVFFNKRTMQFSSLRKDCYRPVRTPEQIAAEEREAEVSRMVATVPMLDKGWARKVCYALYDNNYRKQEPR